MSDQVQSSEVKTKNITFSLLFSWAFGIIVGIPAIITIFSKPVAGILMLISALIVFPPTYNIIKNKVHISLSRTLKIILVLILLIIGGTMLGGSSMSSSVATNSTTSNQQQVQPAIQVSASKLMEAYKANEVAADAVYKNNKVEVTGYVNTIGKDILDNPYIALSTGEQYAINTVQCMFSKADEASLAKVSKGQQITLSGTVSGKLGNVLVQGCQIVK